MRARSKSIVCDEFEDEIIGNFEEGFVLGE